MSISDPTADDFDQKQTRALRDYMAHVRRRLTARKISLATAVELVNGAHASLRGQRGAHCEALFCDYLDKHGAECREIQ